MPSKQLKAIDRLPIINAAGKEPKLCESVGEIFKEYPREEFAEKLCKKTVNKSSPIEPVPPIIPECNRLKDILAPDFNKSRFLEFKDQFYEKLYCKKVPLGNPTPTNSKPDHVTNENVTFGKISAKSESVYDIALPNKSPKEVLKEFVKWHDKYKISHGSYFPSEQINRGYNAKFNRNQVFGELKNADVSGKQVKHILQGSPNSSKMFIVSKLQEGHIERHHSLVGKQLRRQEIDLSPETTFGLASSRDEYNVARLLKNSVTPDELSKHSNETTYRMFANDLKHSNVECKSAAGKIESPYPRKGECKFFTENLGEETSVKQLISPTIPIQFGLSHRDFLLPRSKDQIKEIFTKAGWDVGDDKHFEEVWSLALTQWTSIGGCVSVEAFKYALDKMKTN